MWYEKLLSPFTAPGAGGTVFRDAVIAIGALLTVIGSLGVDAAWIESVKSALDSLLDPAISAAFGVLIMAAMSVYRAVFKSTTPEGEDAAKKTEAFVSGDISAAVVHTPAGVPDIVLKPANGTSVGTGTDGK